MRAIRQLVSLVLFVALVTLGLQYGKLIFIQNQVEQFAASKNIKLEDVRIVPALVPHLSFSIADNNKRIAGHRFEVTQKLDELRSATLRVVNLKIYRKKQGTVLLDAAAVKTKVKYHKGVLMFEDITSLYNKADTKVGKFFFPELNGRIEYDLYSRDLRLKLNVPSLRTLENPDVDVTAASIVGKVKLGKEGANGQVRLLISSFKPSLFKHLEKTKKIQKGMGKILQFGSNILAGIFKGSKVPVIIDYKNGEPRYRVEFPAS